VIRVIGFKQYEASKSSRKGEDETTILEVINAKTFIGIRDHFTVLLYTGLSHK
jgi:hypothetical protein